MDTAALVWLVVGLALIAAEVISGEFVLLMLGGGALAAAVAAALGFGLLPAALVFGGTSVLLLFGVRPVLRRRLHSGGDDSPTNVAALVGGQAVVVERVDARGGQVKLAGDLWSARPFDGVQQIEPGSTVRVLRIDGATALVVADE
ncbi:MAG TPA: NfeD family protein [Pseudonocardia sp.]|jgi:membrane protein implicated in regulation of membrane protease activity|nr:NfeD family protein [Pseudonocardia sp.]